MLLLLPCSDWSGLPQACQVPEEGTLTSSFDTGDECAFRLRRKHGLYLETVYPKFEFHLKTQSPGRISELVGL